MIKPAVETKIFRCALYTRKSDEKGLEQKFNALDSQRSFLEDYCRLRSSDGLRALEEKYDDGAYTGANTKRPGFQKLMEHIRSGLIDRVIVYKIERIARSNYHLYQMLEEFRKYGVELIAASQGIDTSTSVGEMLMGVAGSMAQFERKNGIERTLQKIAATKARGMWTGGWPPLGYDTVPGEARIVVNEKEAEQVREVFRSYLELKSITKTIDKIDQLGIRTKKWMTQKRGERDPKERGGKLYTKGSLQRMLSNIVYMGKITHGPNKIYDGVHEAIIDEATFNEVQKLLVRNRRNGSVETRAKHGALLKGLLFCAPCKCSMVHTYAQSASKLYRYYQCLTKNKRGHAKCPSGSLPVDEIEQFVVNDIKRIGRDPALISEVIKQERNESKNDTKTLKKNENKLRKELETVTSQIKKLVTSDNYDLSMVNDLNSRSAEITSQLNQIEEEMATIEEADLSESEMKKSLTQFDTVWDALTITEKCRIINLIIKRIDYDGANGTMNIAYHDAGLKAYASEVAS